MDIIDGTWSIWQNNNLRSYVRLLPFKGQDYFIEFSQQPSQLGTISYVLLKRNLRFKEVKWLPTNVTPLIKIRRGP